MFLLHEITVSGKIVFCLEIPCFLLFSPSCLFSGFKVLFFDFHFLLAPKWRVIYFHLQQAAKAELGNQPKKMGGSTKEGIARCTFEDRILMSDIVFLRAWTQVDIPQFFNPVTTLLQPHGQAWKGMKTVAELRRENNLPIPHNKDSVYKVAFSSLIFCEGSS